MEEWIIELIAIVIGLPVMAFILIYFTDKFE